MNITSHKTFTLMKTSWRCLEEVFCIRLKKTSSRHLENVWSRRIYSPYSCVFRKRLQGVFLDQDQYIRLSLISSRHLQDVSKRSLRCLQDVLQKGLQDIFKRFSRRFEDVLQKRLYKKCVLKPFCFRSVLLLLHQIIIHALGRI